jgi:hypothetical protein
MSERRTLGKKKGPLNGGPEVLTSLSNSVREAQSDTGSRHQASTRADGAGMKKTVCLWQTAESDRGIDDTA